MDGIGVDGDEHLRMIDAYDVEAHIVLLPGEAAFLCRDAASHILFLQVIAAFHFVLHHLFKWRHAGSEGLEVEVPQLPLWDPLFSHMSLEGFLHFKYT